MHDRSLAKLSLLMALAGLVGLFLVNLLFEPVPVRIADIDESWLGQMVSVKAEILRAATSEGDVFLDLHDGSGEIRAVVWRSVARGTGVYDLRSGDGVIVTGQIATYRGTLEIVVSKIEGW